MVKGKRVLLGLGALLTVGVLFGSASSGSAASPAVTFTLSCSPGVLTPGTEWGCSGTIANNGPQTAAHMTLVQEIEGASLVASTFEDGACTPLEDGGVSCALGNFSDDEDLSFTTIFDGLPSTGTVENFAYVTFAERGSEDDTGKQDTVCANAGTPPCAAGDTADLVAAGEEDDKAGGYVAFDGGTDTLATTGTPAAVGDVLTGLEIPFREGFPLGFGATILEATDPAGDQCPVGKTCFGQTVIEDLVGEFDTEEPVELTFRLIAPNGKNANNIVVYHNGEAALACKSNPLSATVDTCVDTRSSSGGVVKVVTLVVLSTDNGGWDFG